MSSDKPLSRNLTSVPLISRQDHTRRHGAAQERGATASTSSLDHPTSPSIDIDNASTKLLDELTRTHANLLTILGKPQQKWLPGDEHATARVLLDHLNRQDLIPAAFSYLRRQEGVSAEALGSVMSGYNKLPTEDEDAVEARKLAIEYERWAKNQVRLYGPGADLG